MLQDFSKILLEKELKLVPDNNKIALSNHRLENAKEDYLTAVDMVKSGHYKSANNRAYYSIFHSIRAVLALEGIDFKKHSAVISHFNQYYIKTGKIENKFFKLISDANLIRNESDYNDFYIASKDESELQVYNAREFYDMICSYIEKELEYI